MNIVITGIAVWDSLGCNLEDNFQKLLAKKICLPNTPTVKDYLGFGLATNEHLDEFSKKHFTDVKAPQFFHYGPWVIDQALQTSGLIENSDRIGCVVSSIFVDANSTIKTAGNFLQGRSRSVPSDTFYTSNDGLVSTVTRVHKINGFAASVTSTCSSGLYGIEIARMLIQSGTHDQVIVLGQDICTDKFNSYKFSGTGALTKQNISRPFDTERDGVVFGDGIAAVIIESEESALSRKAKIFAKICGLGLATDNTHRTDPLIGSYYKAFNIALNQANINIDDIKWINAHSTSTPIGDKTENYVMSDLLPNRCITSFKGHLGHTMGASGLIELIYGIESMKQQVVPHIGNTNNIELKSTLNFALDNIPLKSKYMLKNSYGFSGKAGSIIVSV